VIPQKEDLNVSPTGRGLIYPGKRAVMFTIFHHFHDEKNLSAKSHDRQHYPL